MTIMALRQRARCCHAREAPAEHPDSTDAGTGIGGPPASARGRRLNAEDFAELRAAVEAIGATLADVRAGLAEMDAHLNTWRDRLAAIGSADAQNCTNDPGR